MTDLTTEPAPTAVDGADDTAGRPGRRTIVLDDAVEIARPPEDVYAYLLDVTNDPVWQQGLAEARFTSAGPVDVGTTGVHVARPFGLTVEVGWQLTDVVEGRRLAWTFVSGPFTGHEGYELEPTPTGTRLSHRADLAPSGLLRVLRPLIAGAFVSQSEQNMEALKALLEATDEGAA